jgi:hypothetical protein
MLTVAATGAYSGFRAWDTRSLANDQEFLRDVRRNDVDGSALLADLRKQYDQFLGGAFLCASGCLALLALVVLMILARPTVAERSRRFLVSAAAVGTALALGAMVLSLRALDLNDQWVLRVPQALLLGLPTWMVYSFVHHARRPVLPALT